MFSETIELRGHIIDSLILPKVLDQILTHGANFKIGEIKIGKKRADQSFARIEVSAETTEAVDHSRTGSGVATCAQSERQSRDRRGTCNRPDRRWRALGAPYRVAICRSSLRRKFICSLRRGTGALRHLPRNES